MPPKRVAAAVMPSIKQEDSAIASRTRQRTRKGSRPAHSRVNAASDDGHHHTAETPGAYIAKRGVPRVDHDVRSVNSIHSTVLYRSQQDDSLRSPAPQPRPQPRLFAVKATPPRQSSASYASSVRRNEVSPPSSSANGASSFRTAGSRAGGHRGTGRSNETMLEMLGEYAVGHLAAMEEAEAALRESGPGADPDVAADLESEVMSSQKGLSAMRSVFCEASSLYITDEDIKEAILCEDNSERLDKAKVFASVANLAQLYDRISSEAEDRSPKNRKLSLKKMDEGFPGFYNPVGFLRDHGWLERVLELGIELRTQHFIASFRDDGFLPQVSPREMLAICFCSLDPSGGLDESTFKGFHILDHAQSEDMALLLKDIPPIYGSRARAIEEFLPAEEEDDGSLDWLSRLEATYPFDSFRDKLKDWISESVQRLTTEQTESRASSLLYAPRPERPQPRLLGERSSSQIPRPSQNGGSVADDEIYPDDSTSILGYVLTSTANLALPRSSAAAAAAAAPGPPSSQGRKRARTASEDEDVGEDDFQRDERVPDSQVMGPPPRPNKGKGIDDGGPRSSLPDGPRAKRARLVAAVAAAAASASAAGRIDAVDPSLIGGEGEATLMTSAPQHEQRAGGGNHSNSAAASSSSSSSPSSAHHDHHDHHNGNVRSGGGGSIAGPSGSAPLAVADAPAPASAPAPRAPAPGPGAPRPVAVIAELIQRSKTASAEARLRKPPAVQVRRPWSQFDTNALILAVAMYDAKWSKIQDAITVGEVVVEAKRDPQALRDKARLLKQDLLKGDSILPPGFDLVVLGKKEREAVIAVGRNPNRTESDVLNGVPVNTRWPVVDQLPHAER